MHPVQKVSALVLRGDFNEDSRKYPIWDFIEKGNRWFDTRDHAGAVVADIFTEDCTVRSPHAELLEADEDEPGHGAGHAFIKGAAQLWTEPMDAHEHVNSTLVALERPDGWDVYAHYAVFANVAGSPAEGEEKVQDLKGKEWDVEIPVVYHWDIVNDHKGKYHGLRIRHISVVKDTGVVNDKLDARGLGHKRSVNSS